MTAEVETAERTRRVLVVDDDESIREMLEMVLTGEGYQVALAEDGVDAIEVLSGFSPDAIVLDLRMPRMDGKGFCRAYRDTQAPRAPILLLTAARNASASADEIGADAALQKPFDLDELSEIVARLTRRRRGIS